MSILITDPRYGVRLLTRAGAVYVPCTLKEPTMPAMTREHLLVACPCARDLCCLRRKDFLEECRMPAVAGLCALCPSPCGRFVYQLSGEADAVHTRHLLTGELLFSAPVGVFPRTMKLSADGGTLLIAGGTVDEAYLLTAPELRRERTVYTKSPCFAADFWLGGLVLVCAVEGEDIHTAVYTLAPHTVRPRKLLTLSGRPGALCVCPDRVTALLSTPDGLMRIDLQTGQLLWNLPELALCMRVEARGDVALVSDTLTGQVHMVLLPLPATHRVLFSGTGAQAAFPSG